MAAKYDRIANDLRQRISEGALAPGSRLPSEAELLQSYDVSLGTVRRAIDHLVAEGLVDRRQGTGTFVRPDRTRIVRDPTERYQWEKDRARLTESARIETGATERDTGLGTDGLKFWANYEVINASPEIANRLGIRAQSKVLRREYRTYPEGERAPLSITKSYLPLALVKKNPDLLDPANEPWPGGTQSQLDTVGIEIGEITDEITARPPKIDESDELEMSPGVAVLDLWKTSRDTGGRTVEVSHIVFSGDRALFRYRIPLRKWKS